MIKISVANRYVYLMPFHGTLERYPLRQVFTQEFTSKQAFIQKNKHILDYFW